jgi:hypothetical protein
MHQTPMGRFCGERIRSAVSESPVFHTNLVGKRIQNLHNFEALWHDTLLGFAAFSGKQLSQTGFFDDVGAINSLAGFQLRILYKSAKLL